MICYHPNHSAPGERDVSADRHQNVGRDAMDAEAPRAIFCADDGAAADGKGVWSWHPWAGAKRAGDYPRATVTLRSWTPGRARRSQLRPLRREGRVAPVEPVVTNS